MEKTTPDMIDPNYIIGVILKRRWLLILPFCAALIAGIVMVIVLPRIYSASTLILIQPQKVPDEYPNENFVHGQRSTDDLSYKRA